MDPEGFRMVVIVYNERSVTVQYRTTMIYVVF